MVKTILILFLLACFPAVAYAQDPPRCKIVVGTHVEGKPDFVKPGEGSDDIFWAADNSAIQVRRQLPPYSVWFENCHGIEFYFAARHAADSETAKHLQPAPPQDAKVQ